MPRQTAKILLIVAACLLLTAAYLSFRVSHFVSNGGTIVLLPPSEWGFRHVTAEPAVSASPPDQITVDESYTIGFVGAERFYRACEDSPGGCER